MRKAIFITGGGSGIGRAVAQRFAREGWLVGLADINEAGVAETAALLPDGASWTTRLDVRDRAAWDTALAAFAQASGGRLDVLFNNAGVAHGGPFAENQQNAIDQLIDVNFRGVVHGAQALPAAQGHTRIVPAQHRKCGGTLWGGGIGGLCGDQVRGARADRGARHRMGGRRYPGARSDAGVHRHPPARPPRARRNQPVNDNQAITEFILDRARAAGLANVFPIGAITKDRKSVV